MSETPKKAPWVATIVGLGIFALAFYLLFGESDEAKATRLRAEFDVAQFSATYCEPVNCAEAQANADVARRRLRKFLDGR